MVRCTICRLHFSNLKNLNIHYHKHSKSRIIKYLIKFSLLVTVPHTFHKKFKDRAKKISQKAKDNKKHLTTKTLYLNENFHILCSQNEVIIGDSKSHINTFFSYRNVPQTKVKKSVAVVRNKRNDRNKSKIEIKRYNSDYSSRASASSVESNRSLKLKRKVKRKKQPVRGHYHINISKIQNVQSLDDQTGEFYICECRVKNKLSKSLKKADLQIITSDTESCSDTGKTLFQPIVDSKLFCTKCGNGYKTKTELIEHMYIHETFCRLCNTSFPNEYLFREHMRLHIFKIYLCHVCNAEFPFKELFYKHFDAHVEDKTLETVLDMEEDYKVTRYNFLNMNYNTSINSILCFLSDYPDMNYYYHKFFKINCDLCRNEVLISDYENHLQNLHSNFLY